MRKFFEEIFKNTVSKEEDICQMDKRLGDRMEEYVARYKEHLSEKDMEILRDCVYYAILLTEEEAFHMGMKYTVKMLLSLLKES